MSTPSKPDQRPDDCAFEEWALRVRGQPYPSKDDLEIWTVATRRERGRGLSILKSWVDEVSYEAIAAAVRKGE